MTSTRDSGSTNESSQSGGGSAIADNCIIEIDPAWPRESLFHFIWYQGESQIPESYAEYRESWTEHNPGARCIVWSEEPIRALIAGIAPSFLPLFDSYSMIQRVDAAKYFILYAHGGLYVDIDYRCFKPIDTLLAGYEVMIEPLWRRATRLQEIFFLLPRGSEPMNNALMYAARPRMPYFKHLIDELPKHARRRFYHVYFWYVLASTGPAFLSRSTARWNKRHPGDAVSATSRDLLDHYGYHSSDISWSPFARSIMKVVSAVAPQARGQLSPPPE